MFIKVNCHLGLCVDVLFLPFLPDGPDSNVTGGGVLGSASSPGGGGSGTGNKKKGGFSG